MLHWLGPLSLSYSHPYSYTSSSSSSYYSLIINHFPTVVFLCSNNYRVSLRDFVPETMEPIPKPKPAPRRRGRIGLPHVIRDPLFGGYDRGYGGLGLPSFLLRFKYRYVSPDVQRRLDNHLLHK